MPSLSAGHDARSAEPPDPPPFGRSPVHILVGLLKNRSDIQPDTLHADNQGQSEPVFGLCRLLGAKLMPRMRGLSDVAFYRPAKSVRYAHIDALFTGDADWDLIAPHARDMIQVVLSIQAGRVMPSTLLHRLGTCNRRSLLYRASRELGRVARTLFLLRYISSIEVRRIIRAETTKIETYSDFLDWVSFGGPVMKSGDPVEQEKQLKYAKPRRQHDHVLQRRRHDHSPVKHGRGWMRRNPRPGRSHQPFLRGHVLRFGQYDLDMSDLPPPLDPQPLPFETT
jgi:hypothetical protein